MSFRTKNMGIDPNKKTIVFYDKGDPHEYSHVYGAGRILYEHLSQQFNIVFFNTGLQSDVIKNQVTLDRDFVYNNYSRLKKDTDAKNINLNYLYNDFQKIFEKIGVKSVEYFIGVGDTHFQLPLKSYVNKTTDQKLHDYKNIFFDDVSNCQATHNKINLCSKKVVDYMAGNVSVLAFSSRYAHVGFFLPLYLHNTGMLKNECIFFSVDPTIFKPFFINHGIPSKFLYFVDDTRGTRKFEKFDIAQFQHIVYEPRYLSSSLFEPERNKDLLFYGTIFQEKGPRQDMYYQFLHDLNIPNSTLYIPFYKNKSVVHQKAQSTFKYKDLDEFGNLYSDISNHPLVEKTKTLNPLGIPHELKSHKYNLILRCVSTQDSLNFRPVLSVLYDNLPLIDYMYDPCNLQIPKELNDTLVVKNSDDIIKRIEYYNRHEKERLQIIEILKKHFCIYEYLDNPEMMVKNEIRRIIPEFTF